MKNIWLVFLECAKNKKLDEEIVLSRERKGMFGRVCSVGYVTPVPVPGVFLVGLPNLPKYRVPVSSSYRTISLRFVGC